MPNQTIKGKNRINSKFLRQRRKDFLLKRIAKMGFSFIKLNKGTVTVNKIPTGAYLAVFKSKATGKKAFAYGRTFHGSYQNMIRLFNLKYSVS